MSTTFSHAADTIAPTLVTRFDVSSDAQSIVHVIPGRPNPDVTLRPSTLRVGTFEMLFSGPTAEADVTAAEALIRSGVVWTVASSDRDMIEMNLVVTDRITLTLDDDTRDDWVLGFGFQEVAVS